jgi:dihydropteroate synthase
VDQQWEDVMGTMERFFAEKIELAEKAGVNRDAIVIDPGIDFAKQKNDNLAVLGELERLQKFERPVMVPVSRKTVIGEVLDLPEPTDRDAGTVALIASSVRRGAHMVRVHQVEAAWQAVKVLGGLV